MARVLAVQLRRVVAAMFQWGEWEDVLDQVPGHPSSIDAMVKLDEDTICTGSSDGLIRYDARSLIVTN